MASRGRGAGLTIGQLLTLTFGFLLASVVIFLFGMWIGNDIAEQRFAQERNVVRMAVSTPPATPTVLELPSATPTVTVTPASGFEWATATPRVRPTVTPRAPLVGWPSTPTAEVAPVPPAESGWTVQVAATTDLAQALQLVQRLRAKGYDAYTRRRPIAGMTWYRVRVGQFADRAAAKKLEERLKRDMGLEAAFATQE
jgi:cell division septation protein DedD